MDGPVRLSDFHYEEPPRPRRDGAAHWPRPQRWLSTAALALIAGAWLALRLSLHVWWPFYATLGGSMYPTILPGEVAVIAAVPAASLHKGEIVLARVPPVDERMYGYEPLILHRIVAVGGRPGDRWIHTRGDHNRAPEQFLIPTGDVVGRMVALIPYVGYALLFVHSRFALIAAAALFALYILYRLVDWAMAMSEATLRAAPPTAPAALASAAAGHIAPVAASPSAAAPPVAPEEPLLVADPAVVDALRAQEAVLRELVREMHDMRVVLVSFWLQAGAERPEPGPAGIARPQATPSSAPQPGRSPQH